MARLLCRNCAISCDEERAAGGLAIVLPGPGASAPLRVLQLVDLLQSVQVVAAFGQFRNNVGEFFRAEFTAGTRIRQLPELSAGELLCVYSMSSIHGLLPFICLPLVCASGTCLDVSCIRADGML